MKLFFQTLTLALTLGLSFQASSQDPSYPNRLVRIVVPNGAEVGLLYQLSVPL